MSTLRTLLRVLYSLAAALQVVAAIAVATRAWWIAAVFLGAAALLGRGALRGCSRNKANVDRSRRRSAPSGP